MRLLLLLLLFVTACKPYEELSGTYFSDKQDALYIDDDNSVIENKSDYLIGNFGYLWVKQSRKRIKFKDYKGFSLLKKAAKNYTFRYVVLDENSFAAYPRSKSAKEYFNGREFIIFKTKYLFSDNTNSFDKIYFHSSRCFGLCNELHLELDYSGNLKVTDNGNGRDDSAKNENFYGKVSFNDMERLNRILKYSQLKTLEWPARSCFDAPDITLIVCQGEKRYYFKENLPCIPIVSWELTNFLNKLFCYESLKKVDTTFRYEQ